MPRGQYDRTKTKEQRAAEKAAALASAAKGPAKKGPGKKAAAPAKAAKTVAPKAPPKKYKPRAAKAEVAKSAPVSTGTDLLLFSELRQNLHSLTALAEKFDSAAVTGEIDAHVKALGSVRERVFGSLKEETEVVEAEEVEEPAPVAAAPSNGIPTTAGTVPLPPTPATWPTPPAPIPQ